MVFFIFDLGTIVMSLDSIKELNTRMGMAIAAYGRGLVATLTGDHWLGFLDTIGSTHLFTQEGGQLLLDCVYQSAARLANFSDEQVAGPQEAVSFWIRQHHPTSRDKS